MNKSSIDAIMVVLTIIIGKFMTFIFDAMLVAYYGAGTITDAFVMAHAIPTILFDGIVNAILVCFIPVYQKLKLNNNRAKEIQNYTNNTMTIAILIGIIISCIFTILNKSFLSLYARGFSGESLFHLTKFALIMIWAIPFVSAFSVLRGFLQSNNEKGLSNIAQIVTYFALICAIIFFYPNSIFLAYATILGNATVFVILYCCCTRKGWKYVPYLDIKDPNLRILFLSIVPIFMSSLLSEINSIVDKYFSSFYAAGIVTSMSYGYKLSFSIQGIIASSIMIVLYPELAASITRKDIKAVQKKSGLAIQMITYIVYPLVVGGIILSNQIIQCVYGHGNFNKESVSVTANIFTIYLLGVVPMCVMHVGDKICYAMQKTRLILYSSIISVISNIILNYYLSRKIGYIGLVMATTLSLIIGCITTYYFIYKCDKHIISRQFIKALVNPIIPTVIMALLLIMVNGLFYDTLMNNIYLFIMIDILIGGLTYITSVVFFCKEDFKKFKNI